MEQTLYHRNKLISTLLKIGHRDLTLYVTDGMMAAEQDKELLHHFIAWNQKHGKVTDSKAAFPVIALRGLTKGDRDLAENAVAHLLMLDPRTLVRAYNFNKQLTATGNYIPAGFRRLLETGLHQYLSKREASNRWFDAATLQHREPMKRLYRLSHHKPTQRAQRILFDKDYPRGSVFEHVAKLRGMPACDAACAILAHNIPWEVAIGAVSKAKDEKIALALIEGATGNQLINNTQMLTRMGLETNPVLKAAYDEALLRARSDKKVNTLKAGQAAKTVKNKGTAEKLLGLQQAKTEQLGTISGNWAVLADASGSMKEAIELGRKIAALITERVAGKVYLIYFNTTPSCIDVTGLTYEQIVEKTRRVIAGGGTACGSGVDYLKQHKIPVEGIAIISDGGDNNAPYFHDAYPKYVKAMDVEPTVYFYNVKGDDRDYLTGYCNNAGIQIETRDMRQGVDYFSLPQIVSTMRTNRYALVDEILSTPLLTIEQVFRREQ